MSIIDKMKKAHPVYWVLGLGGAALAIDYYVEKDRSVASSIYRKFFGGAGRREEGGGGRPMLHRRAVPMPGATVMPSPFYQTSQIYYPAYPPVHPYRHWMHRGPLFDRGFGHGFGHHGRGFERDWFGSHGRGYAHHVGADVPATTSDASAAAPVPITTAPAPTSGRHPCFANVDVFGNVQDRATCYPTKLDANNKTNGYAYPTTWPGGQIPWTGGQGHMLDFQTRRSHKISGT